MVHSDPSAARAGGDVVYNLQAIQLLDLPEDRSAGEGLKSAAPSARGSARRSEEHPTESASPLRVCDETKISEEVPLARRGSAPTLQLPPCRPSGVFTSHLSVVHEMPSMKDMSSYHLPDSVRVRS